MRVAVYWLVKRFKNSVSCGIIAVKANIWPHPAFSHLLQRRRKARDLDWGCFQKSEVKVLSIGEDLGEATIFT